MGISTIDIAELKRSLMKQCGNGLHVLGAGVSQEIIAERIGNSRKTYGGIETANEK